MLSMLMENVFLINSHIPLYNNHLIIIMTQKVIENFLLNRKEINKLIGKINQDGLTIVPTKIILFKRKSKGRISCSKRKKTL